MEKKDTEKMTGDLMKKSFLKLQSPNFDDELMQKILEQPKPVAIQSNAKLFKNGWRFLILSLALLLLTIAVISYLTTGYSTDIDKFLMAIKMYVLYGGLALFVPLIFTQMDTLLEIFFQSRFKTNVNY